MFNQEITIINAIYNTSTKTKTYKISYVHGFWNSSNGISINGTDLVKSDGITCRILMSEENYVEPNTFSNRGWTLRTDDYIAKGHLTTFSASNPKAFKITNVAVKDYGSSKMQHFEISGS